MPNIFLFLKLNESPLGNGVDNDVALPSDGVPQNGHAVGGEACVPSLLLKARIPSLSLRRGRRGIQGMLGGFLIRADK